MTFQLVVPIIAFSLCLFLTIIVLLKNHRSLVHRLFAAFLFGMGMWGGFIYFMRSSSEPADALTWERIVMPCLVLAAVAFLHFSFLITHRKPKKWVIRFAYLFLLLILILTPTGLIVKGIGEDAFGYYPIAGPVFYLVAILPYFSYSYGIITLYKGYRSSRSYEERNSFVYMIAGVTMFLVGGIIDILSIVGIPVPPMALVGNILFALLTSIALLKYHLLDIQVVIRKGMTYFLVSAILAIPFIALIYLSPQLFGQSGLLWIMFVVLITAFFLQPLQNFAQKYIDKLFYRNRYDFLQSLVYFSKQIHDITELSALCSSFVNLVNKALQSRGIYLLLLTNNGLFKTVSYAGSNSEPITFSENSPLIRHLRSQQDLIYRNDISTVPRLQSTSAYDIKKLDNINAEVILAMKMQRDKLVGILILGEKLSGQPYSHTEIELVQTISTQLAAQLENALLYETERELRKELEKHDTQKTEFLHSIAHELKTPLTAILSSSELLDSEFALSDNSEIKSRLINNIMHSSTLVNKRVSELLDIARMEQFDNDILKLDMEIIEIHEFVGQCVQRIKIMFDNNGQQLKVEVRNTLPKIRGDRERLEQVVFNLLSNANKYSPQDSEIVIKAVRNKDAIVIEVEDEAPLVTDNEKGKIFKPYYRGEDAEERRQYPGLGLGLAISKKIIDAHNGEMWVRNKSNGNVFGFSLPVLDGDEC